MNSGFWRLICQTYLKVTNKLTRFDRIWSNMFGKVLEVMVNVSPILTTIGFKDLNTAFCSFVTVFTAFEIPLEESFIFDILPNPKFMHITNATPTMPDSNALNVIGDKLRIKTNNIVRRMNSDATIYICSKNWNASNATMCMIWALR